MAQIKKNGTKKIKLAKVVVKEKEIVAWTLIPPMASEKKVL